VADLAFRHVGAAQRSVDPSAISGDFNLDSHSLPLLAPFRGIAMLGNLGRGQVNSYRIRRGGSRVDASFIAFSTSIELGLPTQLIPASGHAPGWYRLTGHYVQLCGIAFIHGT
jgi:hypothetical protein